MGSLVSVILRILVVVVWLSVNSSCVTILSLAAIFILSWVEGPVVAGGWASCSSVTLLTSNTVSSLCQYCTLLSWCMLSHPGKEIPKSWCCSSEQHQLFWACSRLLWISLDPQLLSSLIYVMFFLFCFFLMKWRFSKLLSSFSFKFQNIILRFVHMFSKTTRRVKISHSKIVNIFVFAQRDKSRGDFIVYQPGWDALSLESTNLKRLSAEITTTENQIK